MRAGGAAGVIMSRDGKYRVVTDPAEGPKVFRIESRENSRGELAVILMGVDCAERVMLHETVGFQLADAEFVFKVCDGGGGGHRTGAYPCP